MIDPWSSAILDYEKLIEQFGIKPFSELLDDVEDPPLLMKRGDNIRPKGLRQNNKGDEGKKWICSCNWYDAQW